MWYIIFNEEIFQRVGFSNITQSYQVSITIEPPPFAPHYTSQAYLNQRESVTAMMISN